MKFFSHFDIDNSSKCITFFLNGHQGGPGAFYGVLDLFKGDLVSVPYPGHQADYMSYEKVTGIEDYVDSCIDFIRKRSRGYESVSLAGYSMGGALSVIISSLIPVDHVILFAPALSLRKREANGKAAPAEINPRLKEMCDDDDLEIIRFYSRVHENPVLGEIIKRACECEGDFSSGIAFLGKKDPVIDCDKADAVLKRLAFPVVISEDSTHAMLYDEGTPFIRQCLECYFSNRN